MIYFLCYISVCFSSHMAFNNFPSFWERYIFCALDKPYFFFFLINSTDSWKGRMFLIVVCIFYVFAFVFHMVWITFATFATYLASSANLFVVSKFFIFEASQESWYIMLYPFYHVANSDFFWYWWFLKGQNVHMGLYGFIILTYSDPSVFFYSVFLKTISISSGVASDSSLLLTTPLEVFNFACG